MNTPVLLIVFNRLDTAEKVLTSILESGCKKLYIYSDGPRKEKESEASELKLVQQKLLEKIPSRTEVICRFEEQNKGPRIAVGEAISWFFENEEEGIIFEHDCLPHPDFFPFCEELLEHYRTDERIMHISGDNFQFGKKFGQGDYYFSKHNHIWGFATWRRAWKYYSLEMAGYPDFRKANSIQSIFHDKKVEAFWTKILDNTYNMKIETWDYQWTFAMWKQNGLAIIPQINLISNIGFDHLALNTTNKNHKVAFMQTEALNFPLKHPKSIVHQLDADINSINEVFSPSIYKFGIEKIQRILRKVKWLVGLKNF